ncbi:Hypothetical predicted protein [Olea europaea subsp. europaea]|uniref:Uncharacterized protein n=1 Tax=Olea europaea subsp. europaea TaxID=158383 RepID=A0A8S0QZR0_OLEEU|nr:Hypothetical predicted protein [Olea europaea subsp. europaea]
MQAFLRVAKDLYAIVIAPRESQESRSEAYNAFICQQRNQRQRDWRNRVKAGQIDSWKRVTDTVLSENTNFNSAHVNEVVICHDFEASTSNQEATDVSKCVKLMDIPNTAYVLLTCIYCKYCGA